jgi:hypothetical protein
MPAQIPHSRNRNKLAFGTFPRQAWRLTRNPLRNGEGDHEVVEGSVEAAPASSGLNQAASGPSVSLRDPPPRYVEELGGVPARFGVDLIAKDAIFAHCSTVLHDPVSMVPADAARADEFA